MIIADKLSIIKEPVLAEISQIGVFTRNVLSGGTLKFIKRKTFEESRLPNTTFLCTRYQKEIKVHSTLRRIEDKYYD